MKKIKISFATIILIFIVALISILTVFSLHDADRGNGSSRNSYTLEEDRPDIVFETFEHTVIDPKSDRKEFRIKAAKLKGFLLDGKYELQEIEEAVFWGQDGTIISSTANSGIFDEKTGDVSLSGNVTIVIKKPGEAQTSTFTSQDLFYSRSEEVFSTNGPAKIAREGFEASGRGMKLDQANKSVWLSSEVKTKALYVREGSEQEIPMDISAGKANYLHDEARVHYTEGVTVKSEQNLLNCDQLHMYLHENENRIECFGNVHGLFYKISKKNSVTSDINNKKDENENSGPVAIKASELIIYRLSRRMTASGDVTVEQASQILSADFVEFFYGENESGITAIDASGNVKVSDPTQMLTGEKLLYSLVSDRVIVTGNPKLTSENDYISGNIFILHPDQGYFAVKGSLKGKFHPKSEDAKNKNEIKARDTSPKKKNNPFPVIFSADQGEFDEQTLSGFLQDNVMIKQDQSTLYADNVVFTLTTMRELHTMHATGGVKAINEDQNLRCDELKLDNEIRQAFLFGNCRIWKGDSFIEAPEVILYLDKDQLIAQNGVLTHLEGTLKPPEKFPTMETELKTIEAPSMFHGNPVDITSRSLVYTKEQNTMKFNENVEVNNSGLGKESDTITCDVLEVKLSKNEQGFEELFADGSFVMRQKLDQGVRVIISDTAIYRSKEDILTVQGKKVKIIDPQNSITCRRADFYIAKKVYVIEGQQATAVHYPAGYTEEEPPKFRDHGSGQMDDRQTGPSQSTEQQSSTSTQQRNALTGQNK